MRGSRLLGRRCWRVVAVVVAASFGSPLGSQAAQADPATGVGPDSVSSISDPGVTLAVPPDGRLRGWQFAGEVLGVAVGEQLGVGASKETAEPGQKLWVFGLRWVANTGGDGIPQTVNAALVVDGTRITIPGPPSNDQVGAANATLDTSPVYYLASVPSGAADVAVELASNGFAQTFSLTKMAREGSQPAILYRDPISWQLDQPLSDEQDLSTPDPTGDTPNAMLPVRLSAFPVAADLVEALCLAGDLKAAQDVIGRLERLAEAQQHPWGLVTVRRTRATVRLSGSYDEADAEDLVQAAETYRELGLHFDQARCLLLLGQVQRRFKKRAAARASLEASASLFDGLGCVGWYQMAQGELGRISGRRSEPADLTHSERQVVELAAKGLSNKEIASQLFVTVYTVEAHLTHAYAKLGIRSRAQLVHRLAETD